MTEEEVKPPLEGLTTEEKTEIIAEAVKEVEVQDILVCGKCHEVYHVLEEFKEHKENEECKGNGEIKETLKDDKKPQIWAFTLWKNTKFKNTHVGDKAPTSWNIYQTWRAMKPKEKDAWLAVASDMQGLFEIVTEYEKSKIVKTAKSETEEKKDDKKDKTPAKPIILNKVKDTRRAFRTGSDPKTDHLVEKIMSKRYNPRKRTFEYLIKWEHFEAEKNTWEATANLQNCKNMIEEFERNLQIQKEQMKIQKTLEKKHRTLMELSKLTAEGRPQRTSKQKALNQVKAWCGAEADEGEGSGKRLFSDDSDEDETYDKRIKMDESSSDSESSPVVTLKRITKNGLEKKAGTAQKIDTISLPENILIPDAKGIVRINQKQIPALSSGVYVMSKTAGIIKLDTAAASKLTSGSGQTVLKVAPKVGQTSIKLIKKDISNGNSGKTTTFTKTFTVGGAKQLVKNYSGKVYMQRRTNAQATAAAAAAQAKKKEMEIEKEMEKYEDESDGIEELEFPTEIQLPTADSPPPEFTLCPLTGKVLDRDGVAIKGDDSNKDEEMNDEADTTTITTSSSLGNLVSIAAADILEDLNNVKDEMKDDEDSNTATIDSGTATIIVKSEPPTSASPPPLTLTTSAMKSSGNTTSILSTALTNANIMRRGPPKLVPRTQPRPGILQASKTVQRVQGGHSVVTRVIAPGQTRVTTGTAPTRTGTQQIIRKRIIQTPGQGATTVRTVVRQQQPTRVYQQIKSSPKVSQVNTYVATPATTKKVITIPPLVETQTTTTKTSPAVEKPIIKLEPEESQPSPTTSKVVETEQPATTSTISFADSDTPLLITGEDGTIYQVAGQNEEGQTILITHGEDGEQQCLLVAPENASLINQALMKPTLVESQPQEEVQEVLQQGTIIQEDPVQQQPLTINTAVEQAVEEAADESQVVAQIVSANPPSPGGSRKVVLMLPDGNFMMTEVTAEQYAALELDK